MPPVPSTRSRSQRPPTCWPSLARATSKSESTTGFLPQLSCGLKPEPLPSPSPASHHRKSGAQRGVEIDLYYARRVRAEETRRNGLEARGPVRHQNLERGQRGAAGRTENPLLGDPARDILG